MKRLIAIGLAAVLSAAMIAATSSTAAAGYWYGGIWYNTPGPYFGPPPGPYAYYYPPAPAPFYPYYYNPGPPGIITSLFSSVLGAMPGIAPAPRRIYAGNNPHVAWCMRYKTYNPTTNTYFPRRGVVKTCVSPYPYPMVY